MPTFQNNKFRSSTDTSKFGVQYRALIQKRPFLTFGLPFIAVIVVGSFVLTPATAIRYERHDRKVRQLSKEEELNVRRSPRRVDMKDEYYKLWIPFTGTAAYATLGSLGESAQVEEEEEEEEEVCIK
ncbi:Cytochrome c oxidase assembly protein COX16 [Cladobotryum mycophilum]|uniref:Cytochrome c oxidase assembly protein COX16, mitochondrial n=1 Tax=Cladobotryum mycophilum TaxID=491253 RepID=A0ABR0SG63_9HYPO